MELVEKPKEPDFLVTLEPMAVRILYLQVSAATDHDKMDRECIEAAHKELAVVLGARKKLGGSVTFTKWPEMEKKGVDQYGFSHEAVVGMRIAITQAITGDQRRPKAELASRLELLEVASCFSKKFLASVKRTAKLDEGEFDSADGKLEDLKDEPEAKPETEEPKKEEAAK